MSSWVEHLKGLAKIEPCVGKMVAFETSAEKIEKLESENTELKAQVKKLQLMFKWIDESPVIELTPAEIQSGLDRVKWAEGLIRQLPEDHDGRNSWLLHYGTDINTDN